MESCYNLKTFYIPFVPVSFFSTSVIHTLHILTLQSTIRTSIYFSLIVKSWSSLFLKQTSTKQSG